MIGFVLSNDHVIIVQKENSVFPTRKYEHGMIVLTINNPTHVKDIRKILKSDTWVVFETIKRWSTHATRRMLGDQAWAAYRPPPPDDHRKKRHSSTSI